MLESVALKASFDWIDKIVIFQLCPLSSNALLENLFWKSLNNCKKNPSFLCSTVAKIRQKSALSFPLPATKAFPNPRSTCQRKKKLHFLQSWTKKTHVCKPFSNRCVCVHEEWCLLSSCYLLAWDCALRIWMKSSLRNFATVSGDVYQNHTSTHEVGNPSG